MHNPYIVDALANLLEIMSVEGRLFLVAEISPERADALAVAGCDIASALFAAPRHTPRPTTRHELETTIQNLIALRDGFDCDLEDCGDLEACDGV